jgi:peptide/nickel transport system ATP-binding protein
VSGPAPERVASVENYSLSLVRHGVRSSVLRRVDLDIRRGEILGLVGESGSGKSVLALSLLGMLPEDSRPVTEGRVTVGGVDLLHASRAELRRIRRDALGAIFQDPMTSLNPTMRIGTQIGEATHDDAESVRLLQTVGVRDAELRLRVYPHELSGGLRQRVMTAIAVAGRPELIVADEPTTALDVTVQAQLLNLLRELRDDFGCSVLLITHDLGVADQIADRLAVLHHGELVELGRAADVVRSPRHQYTCSLLASRLTLTMPRDERFAPATADEAERGEPAVRIRDLHRTFTMRKGRRRAGGAREIRAVDGVHLDIRPGEALAIVGESGSGKSTLLRIVAGLERPSSGSVVLTGTGGPQMVFQDAGSSLTPWLSIGETLGERLRGQRLSRAEVRARVTDALAAVDLPPEVANARPGELSGGQRQRVGLARATMIPPAVLLCDEPTSALDASLAKSVLALIRDLRARIGMTVLFVTHDLAVARLMGDRIAVMQAGRVVELGPAEQVITEPREEYTRRLLAAVPEIVEVAASEGRSAATGGVGSEGRSAATGGVGSEGRSAATGGVGQ